jgi:hypothetical protein
MLRRIAAALDPRLQLRFIPQRSRKHLQAPVPSLSPSVGCNMRVEDGAVPLRPHQIAWHVLVIRIRLDDLETKGLRSPMADPRADT